MVGHESRRGRLGDRGRDHRAHAGPVDRRPTMKAVWIMHRDEPLGCLAALEYDGRPALRRDWKSGPMSGPHVQDWLVEESIHTGVPYRQASIIATRRAHEALGSPDVTIVVEGDG